MYPLFFAFTFQPSDISQLAFTPSDIHYLTAQDFYLPAE